MGDSTEVSSNMGDGSVIEFTGKIMVVSIVLLLFVVVFIFAVRLYAKWFWHRRRETTTATSATIRRRFNFTAGNALSRGLDPSILKTLPVVTFDPSLFKDGLECAVCLCEVSEGEKARLLPKCNHGFHLDCIDMWFQSHPTCPLCRNPVSNQKEMDSGDELHLESIIQEPIGENPSFPTNVLFWGDESRVNALGPCLDEENQSSANSEPSSSSSSSSMVSTSNRPEGILVIDIPRQVNGEEEQKSPMPTRIRSLKRLLSGNRRVNPSSPRNVDLEQGGRPGLS
ncbi:RING-H2 finger protein ATL60 [Striga hermonthica]|uniref:RING-type E3 ubiquitin transferase n=1 Tax=Striga hermonthica TaxID=68872 RepID=A0A9N7MVK6_STRHE|nr:RING-H2 finger protein ATL60 [Striga hermonthica]